MSEMTREAITYFEGQKKRLEDFRKIYPSPDTVGYQATTKEISFYDMAISALSESGDKELTYAEVETWANEHSLVMWSDDMSEKALSAIRGFEGKTNGEVIQALFPNPHIETMSHTVWVGYDGMAFKREWWNAPYKAESEDEK